MSLETLLKELERDYMTLDQALEYIQDERREGDFTRRQLSRAVVDRNLQPHKIGRITYLKREDVERYAANLMVSIRQPDKLRLRPRSMRQTDEDDNS